MSYFLTLLYDLSSGVTVQANTISCMIMLLPLSQNIGCFSRLKYPTKMSYFSDRGSILQWTIGHHLQATRLPIYKKVIVFDAIKLIRSWVLLCLHLLVISHFLL